MKSVAIVLAISISAALFYLAPAQAQIPLPVYVAPTPVVKVHRPIFHHRARYAAAVPVQVNYPAYYAPQVPMFAGPVPSMSAYYVPTIPVTQTFYAPAYPVKMSRRYVISAYPAVIQPAYWLPY